MDLSEAQRASLDALTRQDGYDSSVSARAQIVLWRADGFSVGDLVKKSGASKPTVYKWLDRYERFGVDGLTDLPRSGRPPEVSDSVRSRIVALTRCTPPAETAQPLVESRDGDLPQAHRGHLGVAQLHRAGVAGPRLAAAASGQLQAVERSGLRGQGGRCRRALPGCPGGCDRAVDRREDSWPTTRSKGKSI